MKSTGEDLDTESFESFIKLEIYKYEIVLKSLSTFA